MSVLIINRLVPSFVSNLLLIRRLQSFRKKLRRVGCSFKYELKANPSDCNAKIIPCLPWQRGAGERIDMVEPGSKRQRLLMAYINEVNDCKRETKTQSTYKVFIF